MYCKAVSKRIPIWVFLIGPLVTVAFFASMALPGLLNRPDFSLSSSSTMVFAEAHKDGISGFAFNSYGLILKSLNGFTGVLSIQIDAPPILHACCNSGNIPLSTNYTIGWGVNPSDIGNETVRITARSGNISHSILVTVVVGDIAVSFNPNPVIIPCTSGSTSGNTTMTLASLNGPTGNITLMGWLSDHIGITSFPQPSVILPRDGMASTTMNVAGCAHLGTWEMQFELGGVSFLGWTYAFGYNGYCNATFA